MPAADKTANRRDFHLKGRCDMGMKRVTGRPWATCTLAATVVLCAAASVIGSGTASKSGPASAAQKATVLEYKMAEGRVLRYQLTSSTKEVADVMGQTTEAQSKTKSDYSFRAKGRKEANYLLGVTVNDMETAVSSAQGNLSPDMSPVKGKTFDMVLSPLGAEVDVSGAEAITFDVQGSTRNIAAGFKMFFPDMPGRPVKVGDSWPSNQTIEEKSSTMTITYTMEGVNTLEGFETIEGLPCARISSKFTGSMSGSGQVRGMDMTLTATIKGTDLIYFALREGTYVQSTSDMVREITATLSGPQNLTIPSTQTSTMEVKLVSR